jgi:basic amino acid/polyamine antiporter, APA family
MENRMQTKKPTVIVALRDIQSFESLMDLAIRMAETMRASLLAVHIVEVPVNLDLSAESDELDSAGKALLAEAQRKADGSFGSVATELIRARHAGSAIVDEAKLHCADLLVLGYCHKNPLSEVLLGSTAQYVMRHAPCRLIVEVPAPLQAKDCE